MIQLFLCNSVYQVMVAIWMKHSMFMGEETDIIISNHMNGGEAIKERLEAEELYRNVYFAKSLEVSRYKKQFSSKEILTSAFRPQKLLQPYVESVGDYTDLYCANFDPFTQLLLTTLHRKNSGVKFHLFEDGLSTYCDFEKYYRSFENYYYNAEQDRKNPAKCILHKYIYRLHPLYGNVEDVNVFNPELMKWNPGCPVRALQKISNKDKEYCGLVKRVFGVEESTDHYDSRYIFFEESFFADGDTINDVELVEELASYVGKENIMVKIHPRNPVNRFAERGFKTNKDTSIPWEVLLLTGEDFDKKIYLTVASSAILNPIMIFGMKIRAYSLFPCLTVIPKRLQGNAWAFLKELFEHYPNMISICNDMSELIQIDNSGKEVLL